MIEWILAIFASFLRCICRYRAFDTPYVSQGFSSSGSSICIIGVFSVFTFGASFLSSGIGSNLSLEDLYRVSSCLIRVGTWKYPTTAIIGIPIMKNHQIPIIEMGSLNFFFGASYPMERTPDFHRTSGECGPPKDLQFTRMPYSLRMDPPGGALRNIKFK